MSGRFAPSPTGMLHLGNLRTAMIAWLAARSTGIDFIVRMEDLDRVQSSVEHERRQLDDLASIGLDWNPSVLRQSDRFDLYRDAIATLEAAGLVYECFCTRREIALEIENSTSAPHLPPGAYPRTCRDLTRAQRAAFVADGRTPALRLRAESMTANGRRGIETDTGPSTIAFVDLVVGATAGAIDDVVLQRNDGVPAYNLAVVVDDAVQGVTQVVRGDDLLTSTPRQIHLQRLLGLPTPAYAHVPLVVGGDGLRLSKRHGSVTLGDLTTGGTSVDAVRAELVRSIIGRPDAPGGATDGVDSDPLVEAIRGFAFDRIGRDPVVYVPSVEAPVGFELRNAR